ncbi:hypothetical protein BU23DRAFT_562673 [Bimuria novae-zelandiae CBS 107.79]|uniref:Uncharacterized protein n=1 Tax=Bimuria novae-zelandiae CBS 107.79 TaxID=1447943 RepID=A0A6A5VSQ7_9PLEO|nr:hypothetical protein BU23DRAFT_562673 [Bimuria novae-zelandiae CBS 107.79]
MVNGSSRQNSAASPTSRRSSRNSRKSGNGTPEQASRHSSVRRASSLRPDPLEDFNWQDLLVPSSDHQGGDDWAPGPNFHGQEDSFDQFCDNAMGNNFYQPEDHGHANLIENSNVAVPGTPGTMNFPVTNQSFGYQSEPILPTPHINGQVTVPWHTGDRTVMVTLSQDQISAAVLGHGAAPRAIMTDGKRSSMPKSPSRQRQGSQFRRQNLIADPVMGQNYCEDGQYDYVDGQNGYVYPNLLDNDHYESSYPDPNAYLGQNQPYCPSTFPRCAPSPSVQSSKRLGSNAPEFGHEQENRNSKVSQPVQYISPLDVDAHLYQFPAARPCTSSFSTYPSRNNSSGRSSESSSSARRKNRPGKSRVPLDKRVSVFADDENDQYQKPQITDFNPEVRINKTTKGLTTRTAKINKYDPRRHYTYTMHPLGTAQKPEGDDWAGRLYVHKYSDSPIKDQKIGESTIPIYELADRAMPADKIWDFILSYPYERNKLTLRIQVQPADAGRRYKKDADKCRFAKCPSRLGGQNRTIKHGMYRVAFDERNDDNYDPYAACCGFVHLYCMERFLDFEYICRKANVEVDRRVHFRGEPKGKLGCAIDGKHARAGEIAENFILAAQTKPQNTRRERGDKLGVRQLERFAEYPVHRGYSEGAWDPIYPFEKTLSYHMMLATEIERAPAQLLQFANGGLGPTKISVHRGDLGMYAEYYVRKKAENSKKGKGKKYAYNNNDSYEVEVCRRVQRAKQVLEEREKSHPPTRRGKKHSNATRADFEDPEEREEITPVQEPWNRGDDSSDDEFVEHAPRKGSRSSQRVAGKQPVCYHEDEPDIGLEYERQPKRPYKRKRTEQDSPQPYPYVPQNPDQYQYPQHQQYAPNGYAGYAEGHIEERASKRARSSIPLAGYQRARSFQPAVDDSLWYNQNYGIVDYGDLDDLGLDFRVRTPTPSPRSPHKRKRSSRDEEFSSKAARSPKRHRSSAQEQTRGSTNRCVSGGIMRQSRSRTPSVPKRHASFDDKPVSRHKTFDSEAPPQRVQRPSRMVTELQGDLKSPEGSKEGESPGRQLRSGRTLSTITE